MNDARHTLIFNITDVTGSASLNLLTGTTSNMTGKAIATQGSINSNAASISTVTLGEHSPRVTVRSTLSAVA